MKKTYKQYLGRLYRDHEYERAAEDYERLKQKYPDWQHSLAKYKGRSPDGCKTDWHLRLWKED